MASLHGNAGVPGPGPGRVPVQQQVLGRPGVQELSAHQVLEDDADGLPLVLLGQVGVQLWVCAYLEEESNERRGFNCGTVGR